MLSRACFCMSCGSYVNIITMLSDNMNIGLYLCVLSENYSFKIGKGNLKKDCHKRELLGYPRPSPLLTLALFTHFLVSQGSESRERAQNYHFIYLKM